MVILIVDDDPVILTFLSLCLKETGWNIFTAQHPDSAIELALESKTVDLLVTDIQLSPWNGIVLAEEIRKLRTGISVLFISGSDLDMFPHGLDMDANRTGFRRKPFSPLQLKSEIGRLVSRPIGQYLS